MRARTTDVIRGLIAGIAGLPPERAPADDDALLEVGFIASVEILGLIDRLETAFGVEFQPFDVLPEHFESVRTLAELVERKLAG